MPYFLVLFVFIFIWINYRLQLKNLPRPLNYQTNTSGAPSYTAGNTSGSPLSELGSHCGFKTVLEKGCAAANTLHATITSFGAGRIYDFALCMFDHKGDVFFGTLPERNVHFQPYCIQESSKDRGWKLHSRLFFLQKNLAALEIDIEAHNNEGTVKPVFNLLSPGGRDLENPYPHFNGYNIFKNKKDGILLTNHHRLPGLKLQAFFLPSHGSSNGKKELHGPWAELKRGEKMHWSIIISFSANKNNKIFQRALRARRKLSSLVASAEKRWHRFENRLPTPYRPPYKQGDDSSEKPFRLAAWALENNLYAPRGNMRRWGSVPSKVYFPFIWGWDTPQHVLGLGEWNPNRAAEVLLTQLEGNQLAPARARYRLKYKGITIFSEAQKNQIPSKTNDYLRGVLNFYSQPPLQSWAAASTYQKFECPTKANKFLQEVLPLLKNNINWWEENRRLPNGFFSFINGLESGLDDSPRFYPRSFLPSFIIGLMPRFLSAVDLNCWLFQSYLNLSYLSQEAGLKEDAESYLLRARKLRKMIDEKLWSSEDRAWLDRRNGRFVKVFTPVIWWPAFLGATKNLEKIRTVIEDNLLNPQKFWGKHGIPSVAFNDPTYNHPKEGYYWRGQIWMINNYSALEVLFRYGYTNEADQLHHRIIQTVFDSKGLYETYHAENGNIGWSSRGPGDPAVMQFGMTSAWITQILLYRYHRFRYIFPSTKQLCGYIEWAEEFNNNNLSTPPGTRIERENSALRVKVNEKSNQKMPLLFLKSEDDNPLLESSLLRVRFDYPDNNAIDKRVIWYWRGESFNLRTGMDYYFKALASGKLIDITNNWEA